MAAQKPSELLQVVCWLANQWHTGNRLAKSQFQSNKRTLLVFITSTLASLLNTLIK